MEEYGLAHPNTVLFVAFAGGMVILVVVLTIVRFFAVRYNQNLVKEIDEIKN
jgi:hypothetical protein